MVDKADTSVCIWRIDGVDAKANAESLVMTQDGADAESKIVAVGDLLSAWKGA